MPHNRNARKRPYEHLSKLAIQMALCHGFLWDNATKRKTTITEAERAELMAELNRRRVTKTLGTAVK